ncbi:hypothetical protein ACFY93_18160 [Streptomyces sp. NPDC008313]|uniref:hypothetical protein n=1 Tax=Streptomyces sp. NPDC008313 TaxID=3364826 RepID=UPI0036F04814
MRTTRALAVSAATFAAVALAAPAAGAANAPDHVAGGWNNPSNIMVMPSVIAPGGRLTVTVDGCPRGGTMTSNAFPRTRLSPERQGGETSRGVATVRDSATPGSYDVTVNCDGRGSLTRPNAFTVIGGVRGGLGGSSSTGATPADMAIGGGLVSAALAGGALFWVRRRPGKRV